VEVYAARPLSVDGCTVRESDGFTSEAMSSKA
jgi:hypothetical protein